MHACVGVGGCAKKQWGTVAGVIFAYWDSRRMRGYAHGRGTRLCLRKVVHPVENAEECIISIPKEIQTA